MSNDDRGLAYMIAGFGLGTLVGTLIGMLLAPKSGSELRADLAEYGKDAIDKAKDYSREAYSKGRDRAREAYEAGRQKASEYSHRVTEKIADVKDHFGDVTDRIYGKHEGEAPEDAPQNG